MANERNLKPFKKGQDARRNTAGRPKITLLSEAIRSRLAESLPGVAEVTYAEMIAKTLVERAMNGDVQAAKELADRSEGKAKQALSVDLSVSDWREMARANGLSENDVINDARRLIEQSAALAGDAEFD